MATMTFNSCEHCNDCDDLLNEILRRTYSKEGGGNKGLLTRWAEQVYGCQTPSNTVSAHPSCAGHRIKGTWDGHNTAMTQQQKRLKDAIEDYDDNDCGDKVADPDAARSQLRASRRMAYSSSVPVPQDGYKGPPATPDPVMPRTWGQFAGDVARDICVGGLKTGGAVIGGAAGGVVGGIAGGVVDGAIGGVGGTFVAPGVGTVGGAATGVAVGATTGAVTGATVGGVGGWHIGGNIGNWLCN